MIPETCEQCGVSAPVAAFLMGALPDEVVTTFVCRTCAEDVRETLAKGTGALEIDGKIADIESWREAPLPYRPTPCVWCDAESTARVQVIFRQGAIRTSAACPRHAHDTRVYPPDVLTVNILPL